MYFRYEYQLITGLQLGIEDPATNAPNAVHRQHNSDSFALLAASKFADFFVFLVRMK